MDIKVPRACRENLARLASEGNRDLLARKGNQEMMATLDL